MNSTQRAVKYFLNDNIQSKRVNRFEIRSDALFYQKVVSGELSFWNETRPQYEKKVRKLLELAFAKRVVLHECSLSDLQAALKIPDDNDSYCKGRLNRGRFDYLKEELIAKKVKTENGIVHLGNSSQLGLVNQRQAWGRKYNKRGETQIQRELALKVPMIPFSVFQEANLDISKIRIIERGNPETIKRKIVSEDAKGKKREKTIDVHFTGASLFEIEGNFYLFDIDRRELQFKIFNPFLVKLPRAVTTIAEAYETLKPKTVVEAERKKQKVLRQGEWFFVPTKIKDSFAKKHKVFGLNKDPNQPHWRRETMRLQAGDNSPNYAQLGFKAKGVTYVKGKIEHSGREHHDLVLSAWYIVVPNTAQKSFTLTGDVD